MTDGTLRKAAEGRQAFEALSTEEQLEQMVGNGLSVDEAIKWHIGQLAKLHGLPHRASSDEAPEQGQSTPEVAVYVGDKLISVGLSMMGWDEEEHREGLMRAFKDAGIFGPDGNTLDPHTTPWCAGWIDLLFYLVGLPMVGSLMAKEFYRVGVETRDQDRPPLGNLACWRNHVALFVGYGPKRKILSAAEWNEVQTTPARGVPMVLGGNQSDGVNISPAEWYSQYSKFLGFRELGEPFEFPSEENSV